MKTSDEVREKVSADYAKMVTGTTGCGCCGGGNSESEAQLASMAGYGEKELGEVPAGLAESSFGCGNPLAHSELGEGETVLDLGSGAGLDLLLAASQIGPTGKVIGVDMTDEMLFRAEENVRRAGAENVELRKGIIEALPVEDGSVDWVISNCVINLSPEKGKVFAEIARVLKPGGRMIVSDIVADDLPEWVTASEQWYSSCVAGAVSEGEYLAGLEKAGLIDVEVRGRLVYDAAQLAALAGVGDGAGTDAGCCGVAVPQELIERATGDLAGKIWSAKVFARKP